MHENQSRIVHGAASRHPLTEHYDKRRHVVEQETDESDERQPQRQPVRARLARPFGFQIRLTEIANEVQDRYWQGTLRDGSGGSVVRRDLVRIR